MSQGFLAANPFVRPDEYDFIVVAGTISPGLFQLLDGANRPYKWDTKDAAGAQGATITYRGLRPSEIKTRFCFWTPDQIDTFYNSFVHLLQYDATKTKPKPVIVFHPALLANDITSLVVTNIGQLKDLGGQLWSVAVDWLEYRPAKTKNITTTPKATKPANSQNPGAKPTVLDTQDAELSALTAEARKPL